MEEMKIIRPIRRLIEKIFAKMVKKQFGIDCEVLLAELNITSNDGDGTMSAKIVASVQTTKDDFNKLVKDLI